MVRQLWASRAANHLAYFVENAGSSDKRTCVRAGVQGQVLGEIRPMVRRPGDSYPYAPRRRLLAGGRAIWHDLREFAACRQRPERWRGLPRLMEPERRELWSNVLEVLRELQSRQLTLPCTWYED